MIFFGIIQDVKSLFYNKGAVEDERNSFIC